MPQSVKKKESANLSNNKSKKNIISNINTVVGDKKIYATGNSKKTRYIKRGTKAPGFGGKNDVFGKK